MFSLPEIALRFLEREQSLDFDPSAVECGVVSLRTKDQLRTRNFWVNGEGRWADDPHANESGYYSVPAVDLVRDADGYDPDGILLWIPVLKTFGTWDSDHWDLITFVGVTWDEIVADPAPFLNAQWDPSCEFGYLRPWEHNFPWSNGVPW